jgi:hypothetical protein
MKTIVFTFLMLLSLGTKACPFCNSTTAKEIRASLFGRDLYFNLSVTILPFLLFSVIVYLIHQGRLPFRRLNK